MIENLTTIEDYRSLARKLDYAEPQELNHLLRYLCRNDLFFLLWFGCGRKDMLKQWLIDRCKEVESSPNGYLDLWAREHYKDINMDTPILTSNGWKKHGDLKPGDQVYSPSGKAITVLASNKFTDSKCYKLTFCNDINIIAGGGHLWEVEMPSRKRVRGTFKQGITHGKRNTREPCILTTKELADLVGKTKYRIGIKLSKPLQNEEKKLTIDPYVLGAWLGDGYSAHAALCGIDSEIFEEIERRGYKFRDDRKQGLNRHKNYRGATILGLQKELRNLNLIDNKHIPEMYFMASEDQRRGLLQGLVDTDGNVSSTKNATVTFSSSRYDLAKQVQTLAISLGYKARLTPARTTNSYHVCFLAYKDSAPCLLKRKLSLLKEPNNRHLASKTWYINSIEETDTVETNCIQVDSEDGLYLVGEHLIPTHNSTIITFGKSLQDILSSHGDNPDPKWEGREVTIGIFSCTRPIAKGFLRQLKVELETNGLLKSIFPEILWDNPHKEAPKWSEDDGLVVKRRDNPKEATVEAWGVVEGQPTSKHFFILNYDDIITLDHVRSPDMITKVLDSWEKSVFLGAEGGYRRYIGTRYHFNDTYGTMLKKGAALPRIYPATHNGQADGEPVLHSKESLAEKRRSLGIYSFASQMLLDPKADTSMGFKREWLRFYDYNDGNGLNKYIVVDPANSKKKSSDYTVMQVWGLGADKNYYLLDMVRDRLSLTERGDWLFRLHRKWSIPLNSGYEHYGMQADIDYIRDRMNRENYHFPIAELKGNVAKEDRIAKLIPLFEEGRIYLPHSLFKVDYEGKSIDLIDTFLSHEYDAFPVSIHDDMLDCMARILDTDLGTFWPISYDEPKVDRYQQKKRSGGSAWAA